MKTELENTKITNGFITPNDYFDTLSNQIVEKINGEATSNLIPKKSGFILSEDFFVKNEAKLLTRINFTEAKVVSLKHMLYKVSGIAAVLLLTIISPMLYHSAETKNNELVEISYLQLHSEELSVYEVGSMLEDKELIDLENELIYNNLNNIN
jgi:purine-nucleoside phosphorylase